MPAKSVKRKIDDKVEKNNNVVKKSKSEPSNEIKLSKKTKSAPAVQRKKSVVSVSQNNTKNKKINNGEEIKDEKKLKSTPETVINVKQTNKRNASKAELSKSNTLIKNNNKKFKIEKKADVKGDVYTLGQNVAGQLGLSDEIDERKKPAKVNIPEKLIAIAAGGMHSLAVGISGKVYSWGCNDEGALGRDSTEDDGYNAGIVNLPESVKVVSVTAGDAHSTALTDNGILYLWGVFNNQSGKFGLIELKKSVTMPQRLIVKDKIIKVCSGVNHIIFLTDSGVVFTMGVGDNGQLGRVSKRMTESTRHMEHMIQPKPIVSRLKFSNIFSCELGNFCIAQNKKDIYSFGLNVYGQLGFDDNINRYHPTLITNRMWVGLPGIFQISGGDHHTLVLDTDGNIWAIGRHEYGRLGIGKIDSDPKELTKIEKCSTIKFKWISTTGRVSLGVGKDDHIYSWGTGNCYQTGVTEDDDDRWTPELMGGQKIEGKKAIMTAVGGQHSVLLVCD